jgi:hypothetical protein
MTARTAFFKQPVRKGTGERAVLPVRARIQYKGWYALACCGKLPPVTTPSAGPVTLMRTTVKSFIN